MKILVSWLREFVAADADPRDLADLLTMRGFEVSDIAAAPGGAAGDAVLDLEITTNRPDCLSVRGVAREVSTIYGLPQCWTAPIRDGGRSGTGTVATSRCRSPSRAPTCARATRRRWTT